MLCLINTKHARHVAVTVIAARKAAFQATPPDLLKGQTMRVTEVTTTKDIFADGNEGVVTVIGHGVNVRGVMGAGFAALIARRFPAVKAEYVRACSDGGLTAGITQVVPVSPTLAIANIASQMNPGADATVENLRSGLEDLYLKSAATGVPVHVRLPLIGAGIGGIDPLTAAGTILSVADGAAGNIATTLHLLPSDEHTEAVVSYHRGGYMGSS